MRCPSAALLLSALSGVCACGNSALPPVSLSSGGYTATFDPGGLTLALFRGPDRLALLPADGWLLGTVTAIADNLSYDPYWLDAGQDVLPTSPPDGLTFRAPRSAAPLPATAPDQIVAHLDYGDGYGARLSIQLSSEGRYAVELVPDSGGAAPIAFLRLRVRSDAQEGFYGLGMWNDEVNHRGHIRPMQLEFDNTESANNEARVPIPLLIGTRGWGLFVESRRVGAFDVARAEPDLTQITYDVAGSAGDPAIPIQDGAGLRFHLLAADLPIDIPRRYFDITGDPLLPAPWALGPWLWRDEDRDQAMVLDDMDQLRTRQLPTSAIWLDRPYASAVNSFDYDPARYSDPQQLIATAHARGFRMAVWSSPYLEKAAQPLRAQADQGGYFPPQEGVQLNSWSPPIDFTNPAAYHFWQGLIRRYSDNGIEGFKLDYGEDVVAGLGGARTAWKFADGSTERTMHYGYTVLYHRVYAAEIPASGGFQLCRTGRWGDQRNVSVIWPGDMDSTFTAFRESFTPQGSGKPVLGVGGLPTTVIQGLTLSTSGFPFFGADTGGFRHSPADNELYIRWFQQTALSTVMQVGDSTSDPVWVFTPENGRSQATVDLYQRYTALHIRLFAYEWTYAQRMKLDGRPIVRPFGFAFPELAVHPSDQYMFGDDLLVAPVLVRAQTQRPVILPAGDWIDYWDGSLLASGAPGRTVMVATPLEQLPLYLRAGAILPLLRPSVLTLSPATDPLTDSFANDAGALWVRVVPGPSATSFALYDGSQIDQEPGASAWTLHLQGGTVFQKGAVLELLRTAQPRGVTLQGAALASMADLTTLQNSSGGWYWDGSGPGTLYIRVPGAAIAQVVVVSR